MLELVFEFPAFFKALPCLHKFVIFYRFASFSYACVKEVIIVSVVEM